MSRSPRLAEMASRLADALTLEVAVADQGLEALLPALVAGFRRALLADPSGGNGFIPTLGRICGPILLRGDLSDPLLAMGKGNLILAEVFGLKDVSRLVAACAAQITGLSRALLQQMLPIVAVLVARQLVQVQRAEAEEPGAPPRRGHGPARAAPAPDLYAMFEVDDEGDPLDDMIRRGSPD